MSKFWSERVGGLSPYVAGEQPRSADLVKLNTNENPYPPSPSARAAVTDEVAAQLRLYPDPESTALKEAAAARCGLARRHVFVGNGSDEVLALSFAAFFAGGRLRLPDISYSFYPVWSQLFGVETERIPLTEALRLDLGAYRGGSGGIIFANPNAPTGLAVPRAEIEALLRDEPDCLVVVDEAYVEFGAESVVELVARHDNLLVVQTLSKSHSLAGLRVGFAFGHPDLIEALDRVKNSFNSYPIDRIAERVAIAALEDEAHFRDCRDRIVATRAETAEQLADLGFDVLPSSANFLFARHPDAPAAALFAGLRERDILVRHFAKPRIESWLRISIGTESEMRRFTSTVAELLAAP